MNQQTFILLLIGATLAAIFPVGTEAIVEAKRTKRQAPNINVHQIPKTGFTCADQKVGEYYADTETGCQVYHVCIPGMHNKMALMSFVCPNGTIFNQATRVCSPYDRVDCRLALQFYESLHGNMNSRRTDYETDNDYDNYVPPAPRSTVAPRQPASIPRQTPVQVRPQPQPPSRHTSPPSEPEEPVRPPPRFRSGASQFRGSQSRPVQTPAPASLPAAARPPPPVNRQPVASAPVRQPVAPPTPPARPPVPVVRPNVQGFRSVIAGRSSIPVTQAPAVAPVRPTVRAVVSTSTSNYNYEYEYEYDYEDEAPDQGNARSKRDVLSSLSSDDYESQSLDTERDPQKTSFSCLDKVPGGVYADMETDCEMFHICVPLGKRKILDYKVYCANNTAFDQETGSCKEKSEFKCENSDLYYQFEKLTQSTGGKKPSSKKSTVFKSKKVIPVYKTK